MIRNLTVLLTTYNDEKYIKNAIESILRQSFREFELLIIDDGSTDKTSEIVESIKDDRIRYVINSHHGFAHAQNYGLQIATFDWIAKMDADDLSHPDRLKTQLNCLKEWNEHCIITCNSVYFKENKILYSLETPIDINTHREKMALHPNICHAGVIYNRNFIIANGGYNERLPKFEDYDLWLRLLGKCSYVVCSETLYFIRVRKDSLSNKNAFTDRKIIYGIQTDYYEKFAEMFSINEKRIELEHRGWREYFFGDKNKVAGEWGKIPLSKWNVRMILAILTTILPEKSLHSFRESRLRLRLKYLLEHQIKNKKLHSGFISLLNLNS